MNAPFYIQNSTHMGAKYAEQSEFTKTNRESLESEGININIAATYSALFNLGITTDTVIDTETLKKWVIFLKWQPCHFPVMVFGLILPVYLGFY